MQALRGARAAGREKEGELATTPLESEFHLQFPCGSPTPRRLSCQIFANQREAETNTEKHVPGVMLHYEWPFQEPITSAPAVFMLETLKCLDAFNF